MDDGPLFSSKLELQVFHTRNQCRITLFNVNAGQPVELLPGTSATAGNTIWAILSQGCTQANPGLADCESLRGQLFRSNQSTTWSTSRLANNGLYSLATYQESMLGLSGNAYYGFDTVRLGGAFHPGLPVLQNQLIAGIGTNDFWLGSLGLSPTALNFTNLNNPVPSLLGSLRQADLVPSTSWAYTAGMPYCEPPVYGSLTFGGYDEIRRSNQETVSIPFGTDTSRDLLVGLQSITYNTLGSSPLLSSGIYAFIDSMVSQMWLPLSVCQAFEQAFNLTWNATAELYLMTETQHAALLAQNPTFTLAVGPSASGGKTADIVFPYAAFDLSASQPIVNSETKYFPLKRASNSSQYTLGRVFLQETYVVADYDRRNFSVSQALVPGRDAASQVVAIEFPREAAGNQENEGTQLSTGTLAGIIVGGVIGFTLIIAMFLLIRRKCFGSDRSKRNTPDRKRLTADRWSGRSVGLNRITVMSGMDSEIFEPGSRPRHPPELDGHGNKPTQPGPVYELTDRRSIVELEAPVSRWI